MEHKNNSVLARPQGCGWGPITFSHTYTIRGFKAIEVSQKFLINLSQMRQEGFFQDGGLKKNYNKGMPCQQKWSALKKKLYNK